MNGHNPLRDIERPEIEHTIFENSQIIAKMGSWKWNLKTGSISLTDNLYRLWGKEPHEVDESFDMMVEQVHPEDRAMMIAGIQAAKDTDEEQVVDFRYYKGAELRYVKCVCKKTKNHKDEEVVVGYVQDVTEEHLLRQQLQERTAFLETVLDASVDMIVAFDKERHIIAFNEACEETYGMKKEDVLGKQVYDVFPSVRGSQKDEVIDKVLNGETLHYEDVKFEIAKGNYENYVVPLKDKEGKVTGAIGIAHDITRQKQAIEEVEKKNKELEKINAELASFSYIASHDLQEPLRKIQAFITLIQAKDGNSIPDSSKEYFQRIQASANRMQNMLNDLLSFSRTHTMAKDFQVADLNLLTDQALLTYHDKIKERQATIEKGELPQAVVIPAQFRMMLEHLISNALKFQKAGNKPVIKISAEQVKGAEVEDSIVSRDTDYFRISIADNGVGIEAEHFDKIFQMFQRLHGRSDYSGSGIGLSVCRKVAENHDGIITVQSTPEKGSVFNVYIPTREVTKPS